MSHKNLFTPSIRHSQEQINSHGQSQLNSNLQQKEIDDFHKQIISNENPSFDQNPLALSITAVDLQLRNFKGDAYSSQTKQTLLSYQKVIAIIVCFLSLVVLSTSVYYYIEVNGSFLKILIIISIIFIIISIATFIWAQNTSLAIFHNYSSNSQKQLASNTGTQILFNITILASVVNLFFCIHFYNELINSQFSYAAIHGEESVSSFFPTYQTYMIICAAILVVIELLLFFIIHCEFVIAIGLNDLMRSGFFFNLIFIFSSFVVILAAKKSDQRQQEISQDSFPQILKSGKVGIGCLLVAAVNIIILLRKKRQEFLWIGTSLVLVCCIISVTTREVHLTSLIQQDYSNQNWQEILLEMPKSQVDNSLNCLKYIEFTDNNQIQNSTTYSLQCDHDNQALVWEDYQNTLVDQREYQTACLNQNCKGQLSSFNSLWTRVLVISLAMQNGSLFTIVSAFYQISLSLSKKKSAVSNSDILFVIIAVIIVIFSLVIISQQQFIPEKQQFFNI